MTTNPTVLNWVEEIKALVKPDKEVWINGSKEQIEELKQLATEAEIIRPLNQEKLPGCVIHRTSVGDAARTEQRTFICCENKEAAGPTNNWLPPEEIYPKLRNLFDGVMKNRTMYVIPFCLGNPKSTLCRTGIEITDSIYVVLNTVLLAQCGKTALDFLENTDTGDKEWFRGLHSIGSPTPNEDNRYICHFPQDNSVWAINTGFGSNAFLSKESMSLRLASCKAKDEGWFAEHMSIIEIEDADGDLTYIAVAFPSGCGKTSLAMSEIPHLYAEKGYKIRCISDDVAWLRKGSDGRLRAINPETGIFGGVNGVKAETTPNVLAAAQKDAIFTNVAHNLEDNTVWWDNLNDEEINNILDWRGNPWKKTFEDSEITNPTKAHPSFKNDKLIEKNTDDGALEENDDIEASDSEDGDNLVIMGKVAKSTRAAHSNSRFTVGISQCPCLSPQYNNPEGVPISAIIFGGKRSKTVPLVYQAFDWTHGVFVGSVLGSEPVTGGSTTVRRDPMAMLHYCGYNMADYWHHWLKIGKKLGRNAPKVFNVNWFKTGSGGKLAWPGFGENIRILDWIVQRVKPGNKLGIIETPVGYVPKPEDINIEELENPCPVVIPPPAIITPEEQEVIIDMNVEIDENIQSNENIKLEENAPIMEKIQKEVKVEVNAQIDEDNSCQSNEFTVDALRSLLYIDKTLWKEDVNSIKQFYAKFGDRLPEELREQLIDLEKRLMNA